MRQLILYPTQNAGLRKARRLWYNQFMLLNKIIQKDYTSFSLYYQIKLPLDLEISISSDDPVRLVSAFCISWKVCRPLIMQRSRVLSPCTFLSVQRRCLHKCQICSIFWVRFRGRPSLLMAQRSNLRPISIHLYGKRLLQKIRPGYTRNCLLLWLNVKNSME